MEFRGFAEIVQAQAAAALRDFLGMLQPREAKWREAFSKDPHRRFGGRIEPINHVGSAGFGDLSRGVKAFHERPRQPGPAGDIEARKRFEARQFVFNAYLVPYLNLAGGATDVFTSAGLDFLGQLLRTCRELLGRPATNDELIAFLRSRQMLSASFVDVYSYLHAAMALDRERKAKGSDLNDVLIAATVLPYCDVFATDGHMKHLIVALKLDKRYDVAVFGSRKADVLALTSLVREL